VRVQGLEEAIKRLKEKEKKIDQDLINITEDYTLRVEFSAARKAPVHMGHLRQSISHEMKGRKGMVNVNADYAPFVEFGTSGKLKSSVKVPQGFEKMAMAFKGKKSKGSFEQFKDDLFKWCKSKGIEEKYWYGVLINILKVGRKPQPFLIPSYLEQKVKYEQAVKKYKNEISW
jgi:HK97 gp10 family phage protein